MPSTNSPPILVIGATGQLGRTLLTSLGPKGCGWTRDVLDFSDPDSQRWTQALDKVTPEHFSAVINAAAYTNVEKAEAERDLVTKINTLAPSKLAEHCKKVGLSLVHFSTDYVYGSSSTLRLDESTPPNPLNHYGLTKLKGDEAILSSGAQAIILRTSWVYAPQGKNFLNTMIQLGTEREEIRVVDDQFGAPTSCEDITWCTLQVLSRINTDWNHENLAGVYHLTNSGETTWYGFAKQIFEEIRLKYQGQVNQKKIITKRVVPIQTSDFAAVAKRPSNSRLCTKKFEEKFGIALPNWQDGLSRCLSARMNLSSEDPS